MPPLSTLIVMLALAAKPDPAQRCAALAGQELGDRAATIADAALDAKTGACVAHVKLADSALRFEARLPAVGWNERLAFLGGGGFDGVFSAPTEPYFSPSVVADGYATVSTNGGHDFVGARDLSYFKAEFAYDAQQLADYTYQSEHRALPFAKELVKRYYGAAPKRSYFEGCSMGGHDALIEAQRYPQDFDGIVARAPAGNIMGLFLEFNRIAQRVRDPANALDPAQQKRLAQAVLETCDALDGARDGVVSRPLACAFDPATLACPGEACLTPAQVETVRLVTSPYETADKSFAHAGYAHGGEDAPKGWGEYLWPAAALGGYSLQGFFSDGFLRSFVARDAKLDTAQFDPAAWRAPLALIGAMYQANDPNLDALASRGAKLILWNGATDTSVSPRETVKYYEAVKARSAETARSVELFLAPGVGHCFGGAGPDQVDLLKAVSTWVERGTAPSAQKLVHAKRDGDHATRPLCAYPAYPRYRGDGDVNDAASFTCATD